jgi:predicted nucleotidyltransferase
MAVNWAVRDGRAVWEGRLLSEWVRPLVEQVVATVQPVAVWLIGSVARGSDNEHSDIDLVVVLPSYDPADAIDLKVRVLSNVSLPVPFDVAFSDPSRFRRRSQLPGTLERAAAREGRLIYER